VRCSWTYTAFRKARAEKYVESGEEYFKNGEYVRAIADYDEAIRLDPKDVVAYNSCGLVNAAKGDYDRSIADFGRAIRLNPQFAAALAAGASPINATASTPALLPITTARLLSIPTMSLPHRISRSPKSNAPNKARRRVGLAEASAKGKTLPVRLPCFGEARV
jgi:tetratricopeptide (TPR) repeat protein